MKAIKYIKYIFVFCWCIQCCRAEDVFSEVEGMKSAMSKIQEIKKNTNWKQGDEWFFCISKNNDDILVQKVRIIPKQGLTDLPIIEAQNVNVNSQGMIDSNSAINSVGTCSWPLNSSMVQYLDNGCIKSDYIEGYTNNNISINSLDAMEKEVFPKFFDWVHIAKEKNVPSFAKFFDGRKCSDASDENNGSSILGWVFIWKDNQGGVLNIQSTHQYEALKKLLKGEQFDTSVINNDVIYSEQDLQTFQKNIIFLGEVRSGATHFVPEFITKQKQHAAQQDTLFK
jgi:hypothetical protein